MPFQQPLQRDRRQIMTPAQLQKAALPNKMIPGFNLIDTCKFKIRTIEEAETLSKFASEMFYEPARVQSGLYELLLNAVEHGCLGIGYELKSKLMANNTWLAEVKRRQSLPENRKKHVDVLAAHKPEGIFVVITDPGPGFKWQNWMTIDPARSNEMHGRGIVKARSVSFDSLTYNPAGNQVVAHTKDVPDVAW